MQFPFIVQLHVNPSMGLRLRRAARTWWIYPAVGGLIALVVWGLPRIPMASLHDHPESSRAILNVTSAPAQATVALDGHDQGRTPIRLPIAPGMHGITVRLDRYTKATYQVRLDAGQTETLDADLWLRTPETEQLRPIFPGASIKDAGFLIDGRIVLILAFPASDERQAWLVDGDQGTKRLGPPYARGSLAVAADGEQVAYLAGSPRAGNALGRLDEVWITQHHGDQGERVYSFPATASDERLIDLSWAPDGQHLLMASLRQPAGGGQSTRLRRLERSTGATSDLISFPSGIVAGSFSWSPDGQHVAFLTRSGQVISLCVLNIVSTEFHYLADLSRQDSSPLPFPPLSWSPDGHRLVYAAPTHGAQATDGWLFSNQTVVGLFLADLAKPTPQRLGNSEGQSPVWRADGSVLVLGPATGEEGIVMRQVQPNGDVQAVAEVPLKVSSTYAARWDVPHARALIAMRRPSGLGVNSSQPEYWVVRFRGEVGQ